MWWILIVLILILIASVKWNPSFLVHKNGAILVTGCAQVLNVLSVVNDFVYQGIGKSIALLLSRQGYTVICLFHHPRLHVPSF